MSVAPDAPGGVSGADHGQSNNGWNLDGDIFQDRLDPRPHADQVFIPVHPSGQLFISVQSKSSQVFEWEYVDLNNNAQMIVLDFVPFAVGRVAGGQFCFWNVQRLHRELGLEVGYGNDMKWCYNSWRSWRRTIKESVSSSMHWDYKVRDHTPGGGGAKRRWTRSTPGGGGAKRPRTDPVHPRGDLPWEGLNWPGISTLMLAFIVLRGGYGVSKRCGRMQSQSDRMKVAGFADNFMAGCKQALIDSGHHNCFVMLDGFSHVEEAAPLPVAGSAVAEIAWCPDQRRIHVSDLMMQMKKAKKLGKIYKDLKSVNVDGWAEFDPFLHVLCNHTQSVQLLWQVLAWMTGPFDRLMRNKAFCSSLPESCTLLKHCYHSQDFTNGCWLKKADGAEGHHGNKAHINDGDRVFNQALNDPQ